MALALAALLASSEKLRFPPVKLPLALFFAGTVVSLAASPHPAIGRPQVRKFLCYILLLVLFSTLRSLPHVRSLLYAWVLVAAGSAVRALVQFTEQTGACRESYDCFVGERITGFMSHWMTFGGQMMMVLLLLLAYLFWAPPPRRFVAGLWIAAALIATAILAGGTRSIWLATLGAALYLAWFWKRWVVAAAPLVVVLLILAGPAYLRQRITSIWKPHGDTDSNAHRIVSWRTGLRMIQAHPLLGVGPEHVGPEFKAYLPSDVEKLPTGWYGHLHNIYLHYAAERGIPTMLMLLWMLGVILRDFHRALRANPPPESTYVLRGAIAVVIAILIEGVFELNLGDSEVLMLFLAVVACGYTAVENSIADAQPLSPSTSQ